MYINFCLAITIMFICFSCGSVWYEGGVGEGCGECGGYAMTRPCAVCAGQCGAVWTRSVSMVRNIQ